PAAGAWAEQYDTCLALAQIARDPGEKVRMWREAAQVALEHLADPARALDALQHVADARPGDPEVLAEVERLATIRQDWARAARALEGLAKDDPAAACRLAALRRDRLDDAAGALEILAGILERHPGHDGARRAL